MLIRHAPPVQAAQASLPFRKVDAKTGTPTPGGPKWVIQHAQRAFESQLLSGAHPAEEPAPGVRSLLDDQVENPTYRRRSLHNKPLRTFAQRPIYPAPQTVRLCSNNSGPPHSRDTRDYPSHAFQRIHDGRLVYQRNLPPWRGRTRKNSVRAP